MVAQYGGMYFNKGEIKTLYLKSGRIGPKSGLLAAQKQIYEQEQIFIYGTNVVNHKVL